MSAPAPLKVRVGRSRLLAVVLAAAHAATLMLVALTTLPVWAKLLLGSIVVTSCASSIVHAALLLTPDAIVELATGEGKRVACLSRAGRWHEAHVLDSSFVAPWLTVLNLRAAGIKTTQHLVIVPDNVDPDAFRRLRVWLRWSPAGSGPPPEPPSTQG